VEKEGQAARAWQVVARRLKDITTSCRKTVVTVSDWAGGVFFDGYIEYMRCIIRNVTSNH